MIPYSLIRSDRKTISIEINPEGQVLVRAPRFASAASINAFVLEKQQWVEKSRLKVAERKSRQPVIEEGDKERCLQRAREILPEKVLYYGKKLGVMPTGITVTGAATRFGSCSGKNRLSFSWRLMAYPEEAVDYVVVHELCHILHKDHSPAFYREIERILPDYRQRIKLLKGEE